MYFTGVDFSVGYLGQQNLESSHFCSFKIFYLYEKKQYSLFYNYKNICKFFFNFVPMHIGIYYTSVIYSNS